MFFSIICPEYLSDGASEGADGGIEAWRDGVLVAPKFALENDRPTGGILLWSGTRIDFSAIIFQIPLYFLGFSCPTCGIIKAQPAPTFSECDSYEGPIGGLYLGTISVPTHDSKSIPKFKRIKKQGETVFQTCPNLRYRALYILLHPHSHLELYHYHHFLHTC